MKRIRRILLASDFSSVSKRALGEALVLTGALEAKLAIVHVVAPFAPPVPAQYLDPVTMDRLDAQARQWARDQMTKLVATARKAGVSATGTVLHGLATYDHSPDNRSNPDPTKTVSFGERTWNEIQIGWLTLTRVAL